MKFLLSLSLVVLAAGCVSNAEYDRDQAYSKCESNSNKTSRDRCIADAIQQAERQRTDQAAEQQEDIEEAEQRDLNRQIAGAD